MSIFQLTPLRVPHKGQKATASSTTKRLADLRNFVGHMRLGALAAKLAVVVFFTICWLLIVLVRSHQPHDPASLKDSSLTGLAAAMQQGAISGRDFQSVFGPAAQLLAWMATMLTHTRSALDAIGFITFAFCAASAVLIAAMLLLCDRISWQQTLVFYGLSVFMNLFYDVFDIRTALLLLNVAFAYRTIAPGTQRTTWAIATGTSCFISQLVMFQLGIYSAVIVVFALIAGAALIRNTELTHTMAAFISSFALLNLMLVAFFNLTSAGDALVFDYHNYGFEILRGYHNSMGALWELSVARTIALVLVSLCVVGMSAMAAWKGDAFDAALFVGLGFAAIVWLTTAFVHSDLAQIASAFTPVVVTLSLLLPREWSSPKEPALWMTMAAALIVAWPSSNFSAPADLLKIVQGQVGAEATIRKLHETRAPLDKNLQASLVTPDKDDRRRIPLLAFPYDNYIGIGLKRPLVAPVLETHAVSTHFLESYYLRALQKQQQAGLDIVYGPDRVDDPLTGGVQAITRTPQIFEYIYRNFELVSEKEHADGHYVLRPAHELPAVAIEPLKFSVLRQSLDSGTVKLDAPSGCGLVRVEMRLSYNKSPRLFRPSGVEVDLSNGDERVWQGRITPLEPNQSFATYISPLESTQFHKVFGRDPIHGVKWDKFEYRSLPVDLLGSKVSRVEVFGLQCLDPQKFGEVTQGEEPLVF